MTRAQIKLTIPTPSKGKTRGSKKGIPKSSNSTRVTVPERGIVLTSEKHGEVEGWLSDTIAALGWEVFVEPLDQACSEFVTSFLSAFNPDEYPNVIINGTKISFSEEDINDAFNLTFVPLEEDEFEKYCKKKNDEEAAQEVLQTICYEGTQWERSGSVLRKSLIFEAKVWMHFINSRLIPGSHDTRVNWERAVLAFCIITQKRFDVGRVISKQLAANMSRKSPFYFPCLVTELCKSAGLKPSNSELVEVIPLGASIDQGTLKRLRENEGLEEEDEEKDEEDAEQQTVEEEEKEETETVEGASENIKLEEQQSAPKATPFPRTRKTTAGRRKAPEGEAPSRTEGLSMWARGAEAMAQQMQNIENLITVELRDFKEAARLISREKESLEREIELIKSEGPAAKKMKGESSGAKENQELEETMKELKQAVSALKDEMARKEQEHKEEKLSWSEELKAVKMTMLQMCKYVRDRDAIVDSNWAGKFKGQPRFPQFPDVLPPEAITSAPEEGASFRGEQ